jgi:hypothetical protein
MNDFQVHLEDGLTEIDIYLLVTGWMTEMYQR